jgi:hypothetical protein
MTNHKEKFTNSEVYLSNRWMCHISEILTNVERNTVTPNMSPKRTVWSIYFLINENCIHWTSFPTIFRCAYLSLWAVGEKNAIKQ